jgi:hypothetical protein
VAVGSLVAASSNAWKCLKLWSAVAVMPDMEGRARERPAARPGSEKCIAELDDEAESNRAGKEPDITVL